MAIKKGLGKGLGALLSIYDEEEEPKSNISEKPAEKVEKTVEIQEKNEFSGERVEFIPLSQIHPNLNQPRKNFDEEAMLELADSVRQHGIIQPIVVVKDDDGFMIVAGERRYKAARMIALQQIPCIIKDYTERQIKEVALIENLQREDLNPIEAGRAIKQLMEEYHFTQDIVAERIGKSRPSVTNILRLLTLQPEVIKMVEDGQLSAGHARALVTVTDPNVQIRFANVCIARKLNVREVEDMVREYLRPGEGVKHRQLTPQSQELTHFVEEMQRVFSTKVSINGNDNKGRIYIDYYSKDDLDRIFEIIELVKSKTLTLQDLSNFNKRV